jgi:hypothetical protein
MQLYFPNFKTKQAAIGMFDYLIASKNSNNNNVIFNSDLNLENFSGPGSTETIEKYEKQNNEKLYSFLGFVIQNFNNHNAQVFQDLYVLWKLKNKRHGTFVEIGTGYPTGMNNTWMLESCLDWNGVLVEPNPVFFKAIESERKAPLEKYAIHDSSDIQLTLKTPVNSPAGGGIKENFELKFDINTTTDDSEEISVTTLAITDCLKKHQIPVDFDYLSFDTTGNISDIQTIESMFQNQYQPKVITIGHNYKSHRHDLNTMLQSYGYIREFDYLSQWDDWYCHESLKEIK